MKPIEIHIEGYKIIIMEDKEPEPTKAKEEDGIMYVPYPVIPTTPQNPDWWKYPYVTWTSDDTLSNIKTTSPDIHPVRDAMVGKEKTDDK